MILDIGILEELPGLAEEEYEKLLSDICGATAKNLGLSEEYDDAEVSLILCDEVKIRELNRDFREIDKVTDVLSFPADFEADIEGDNILGDIAICVQRVISQAEDFGHSIKRELCFLFLHGLLHILGFDHIEEEDRLLMEAKQREILKELKIDR